MNIPRPASPVPLFPALLAACLLAGAPAARAQEAARDRTTSPAIRVVTDKSDLVRFTTITASHYYLNSLTPPETAFLFLPPDPPPLDTEVPLANPLAAGAPAPPELAAHLYDLFYPQLATRLANDDLPQKIRQRIAAFVEARTQLQDEVRAALARTERSAAAARLQELAACGQLQAARLAELDAAGEHLRRELGGIDPERLAAGLRAPSASGLSPVTNAMLDTRLLRSAAYFLNGLSAAQRRLLLENALAREQRLAQTGSAALFFFSPEGACLLLPPDLPAPVTSAIATYTAARQELTSAILTALHGLLASEDGAGAAKLQQLATLQAPAFAALDARAEEIRRALRAAVDLSGTPAAPTLPAELAARIATYRDHKQTLLRALHASLTQAARAAASPAEKPGSIAVPVAAFTAEQQAALADLNREKDTIRAALAETRRPGGGQDRKSIDDLLENFERARQAEELRERYREYRIAVLEPGLSPAQRRLLFGAALQSLALPLPAGEPLRLP